MPTAAICPTHGVVPELPCAACQQRRNRDSPYRSPAWRRLRKAKLAQQRECERCGSTDRVTAHHRRGRVITGLIVGLEELEVLCHGCHVREEGDRRRGD